MKTILITGVSSGLGRAFAAEFLSAGHRVIGTVRNHRDIAAFEALDGDSHAVEMDVSDDASVTRTITTVEESIGPLDVVIANAGYGLEGVFEETPLSAIRQQFAVNVFGVAATLQAALPGMRRRRSGHLMAVTSMGGLMTVPGLAAYCASKYAVEGLLGSLAAEVKAFGIHVTAIEPGSFRTEWSGRSLSRVTRTLSDYDDYFDPLRATRLAARGHQPGDPTKAAQAVLAILEESTPPAHLVLGTDALRLVAAARAEVDADIKAWEWLSRTTDFS